MLTIFAIMFLCIFIISGVKIVCANQSTQYDKSFQSLEIRNGDSLLSIAKEYAISETEYDAYINEVKSINNLKSDTIHAGCYLVIPVYQEKY